MYRCFTDIFMAAFRKNDIGVGRSFGVFNDCIAKFVFHMRLQGLSNIDMHSRNLITHCNSFSNSQSIRLPKGITAARALRTSVSGNGREQEGTAMSIS